MMNRKNSLRSSIDLCFAQFNDHSFVGILREYNKILTPKTFCNGVIAKHTSFENFDFLVSKTNLNIRKSSLKIMIFRTKTSKFAKHICPDRVKNRTIILKLLVDLSFAQFNDYSFVGTIRE